jgi:hypothetical protein
MEQANSVWSNRWMAPESLEHNVVDCISNVWSLGVVIWEIYSNAQVSLPLNWRRLHVHMRTSRTQK